MNSELTISTEGDAMAATLLEHANFVRALARRLVRDACEAEDLEQEANRLRPSESVEVDPRALPTEPVELRLPRSGTLILRFVDEDGMAVGSLPGVWLSSAASVGPPNPARSIFVGPVRNGEITINHVRLAEVWEDVPEGELSVEYMLSAQEWKVTVPPGPGVPREVRAIVAGPREPDEVVRRTIRLVAATDPLRGRLLDRDGAPVVDREVLYTLPRLRDAVAPPPARTVITDAHGYFSFPVPDAGYRRPRGSVLFLLPAPDGQRPEIGRWELPRRWPSGGVEAGDITLAPASRVVRGRVVDESGMAVPGAVIEVGVKAPPVSGGDEPEPGPSVPLGALGYAGTATSSTLTYHVEADERGEFELLVAIGDGEVVLTASRIGHGPATPVALGATDERVVLTLPRDGAIVGSITLPEGLEAARLRVGLKGDDPYRAAGPLGDFRTLDAGGHFRLRRVPAGRQTVEIRVDELRTPILEIKGVLVRSGELTTDPRLQEIGIARTLRVFDLKITDELGVAIPEGAIVWAANDDPDAVERPIVFRNGRCRFVTPPGIFRAEVNARGYRRLELPAIEERQRVVMSAGLPVRLILPDDLELPPPPAQLSATLLATEGGKEPDRHFFDRAHVEFRRTVEPPPFDHGRSVDCILSTPGTWRVWWYVGPLDWQGSSGGIEGPQTIEVRDLGELQSFELSPDAAAYAGILERTR